MLKTEPKIRLVELDSLRGVAALFVFFSHFLGAINLGHFPDWFIYSPLHFFWDGAASVVLFFLLSGYVLSLPLVLNDQPINLTGFYIKRVFRLYPPLILAIVISLLVKYFLFDIKNMIPFSPWIQKFWTWDFTQLSWSSMMKTLILIGPPVDTDLIINVIWSLKVEIILSCFFPFLIIIVRKTSWVGILFLLFCLYKLVGHPWLEVGIAPFLMGITLAKYRDQIGKKIRSLTNTQSIFILLSSIILFSSGFGFKLVLIYDGFLISVLNSLLITAGSSGIMLLVLFRNGLNKVFKIPILSWLGEISYSFYLFHFPVLLIVCSFVSNNFGAFSSLIIFSVTLVTTLFISHFVYKYWEMPFQQLGKKIDGLANNIKVYLG